MKAWAAFGALCVFLALLASPAGAEETMRPHAIAISMDDPPRTKPDRNHATILPEGVRIARQCAASTMLSRVVDAAGTKIFFARYSQTAFEEMVAAGCTRVQQGCNTCMIKYTGCTAPERAACADGDCLARVCKRRMICTTKTCSAQGEKTPSCEARFVRQACLASAFDSLDSASRKGE